MKKGVHSDASRKGIDLDANRQQKKRGRKRRNGEAAIKKVTSKTNKFGNDC